MDLNIIIQVIMSGLMLGGIYSLISIGLTIIFGVVKIVNFAHGELLMISMFFTYFLWDKFDHLDPLISLFIVVPVMFLFGALLYRFILQRVATGKEEPKILLTLGLSLIFQNLALMFFSANYRSLTTAYSEMTLRIGEITLGYPRMIAFVASIIISLVLALFLTRSDTGKAMRAVARDERTSKLMGIDTKKIFTLAVGLATAVTGASGSLLVSYYYVYPTVGKQFILMSFIVVSLGGLGNVKGAFLCGLILGISEALGVLFISAEAGVVVAFILLVLVLIFRPEGIMVRAKRRA